MNIPPVGETLEQKAQLDETELQVAAPERLLKFNEEDKQVIDQLVDYANKRLEVEYAQLFEIEREFMNKVRVKAPVASGGGYVKNADGSFVEDWSNLTEKDMEEFILAASQYLVFDSQQSINVQAEAAYATMLYNDTYNKAFVEPLNGTNDMRASIAATMAKREKWRAQFLSHYWKKSKELIDSIDKLVRRVERIYDRRMRMRELERNAEKNS